MNSAAIVTYPDPTAALLFDLDGTVTDSVEGIVTSFHHALAAVGMAPIEGDVASAVVGPPLVDTFASLGLDETTTERALAAYKERYGRIGWRENAVFEGMAELLTDLASSGRPMAIATSKNQVLARRILEHFGLADKFSFIAGASEDGTRRSKADVVEHALAGLGLSAVTHEAGGTANVVMIGDRIHDVEGAAKYGIPAIAVAWGYATENEVHDAAWTVDSVDTLREVLGV
ncbi:HAD hydrolase-like protein [Gordonia effusa]|uniref:HAD hydrolase-like protein n=1 Tax=Gordonia effusa TaxID=263908 RepID=UPI00030342CF|nr:HAD hydrolase-like protein [Gordonia effusa]